MAWNEPGGNKDKDPWGGKKDQQSPPEITEVFDKLQKQIAKWFNLKPSGTGSHVPSSYFKSVGIVVLLLFAIWFALGIFIVNPAERAVILQFGKYKETVDPGLHWIPRVINKVYVVNEQKIDNYSYQALMLTTDENIVSVAVAVQYRIDNARAFLFNAIAPEQSLKQATASALRQVIGQTTLDDILTKGRDQVRAEVEQKLKEILALYKTGLHITTIAMQPARAPDAVKDAFDDAIKAREDEQRFVNQAQAYTMQVEPIAKGHVQRIAQEANAYKEQVVLRATGDTAKFLALLPEYIKAPEVTKQRLYLDVMEKLMHNTTKVLIDAKGNGNMFYLPLDKLVKSNVDGASSNLDAELAKRLTMEASGGESSEQSEAAFEGASKPQLGHYGYSRNSNYEVRAQNESN